MFVDRNDAGQSLAELLLSHPTIQQVDSAQLLTLSIPRGGVVVGDVVARALKCQHEVIVVKKIGFPGVEELAVGALAEGEQVFLNSETLAWYKLTVDDLTPIIAQTKARIDHYIRLFRQGKPLDLYGKTAILVDDGIATGETMKAAIQQALAGSAAHIIVAVPVCSRNAALELKALVDALVCLIVPENFIAVGQFYWHFDQVDDDEVVDLLAKRPLLTASDPAAE